MKKGLAPIVDVECTHLILGTLPGDRSLQSQSYYSHPTNQFWLILGEVYREGVPGDYEHRVAFLLRHGLAVWDVFRSAEREGSLDFAIKNGRPNDFAKLFERCQCLRTIGFNGGKAQALFRRHIASRPGVPVSELTMAVLPSTSPTPGRNVLSIEEKIAHWRDFLLSKHTASLESRGRSSRSSTLSGPLAARIPRLCGSRRTWLSSSELERCVRHVPRNHRIGLASHPWVQRRCSAYKFSMLPANTKLLPLPSTSFAARTSSVSHQSTSGRRGLVRGGRSGSVQRSRLKPPHVGDWSALQR